MLAVPAEQARCSISVGWSSNFSRMKHPFIPYFIGSLAIIAIVGGVFVSQTALDERQPSQSPTAADPSGPQSKVAVAAGKFTQRQGTFFCWLDSFTTQHTLFTWTKVTFEDRTTAYGWIGG